VDGDGLLDGGDLCPLGDPPLASPFEPAYDFILCKLAHVTVYAILAVLLFRAFRLHVASPTHAWLLAMLVAALYGLAAASCCGYISNTPDL
jgi:MFS-type transporter involved in bile tolerance (Atg22 family)